MIRYLAAVAAFLGTPALSECRQALALGLDVSGSVDSAEYRLQLGGLAAALQRPKVKQLLLSGLGPAVRLAVFEWSETSHQRMLLDWTEIRSDEQLAGISNLLNSVTRSSAPQGTAVGSAMLFGAELLSQQPECWKQTLDLSGDGKHNIGPHPREVKQALQASGITINGLVIGPDDANVGDKRDIQISELSAYYNAWVILGPDAFVEVSVGFEAYEDAMTRKLIRELEGLVLSDAGPYTRP
ncbi:MULTISPECIES: DUF1194 domain-containing protein [unclassified Ruegeria]|uniref:DUF1194 domain-containing protein n=1 Tax=unclassified Ruegeria TaxID=2625375 RepID=UPI001AD962BE|nr:MULTISPECIES: DUF1194 domain-containing protein [unclassified Ruegeria]MBO9410273.1 DUF1194 domain-containing protein [Ruegeria sp. R8_1]MBO9414508.1 DUF1194 domain-containing protein [Ruegeria sp. R8_2]